MIQIPEGIKRDLEQIEVVSRDLKMKIYVVGGFPRDIISGNGIDDDTDLDITEKFGNGFDLAYFVSAKYNLHEPIVYENTGTAMLQMPSGRIVEFHNAYFNVPHIIDELYLLGITPSPINKDVYSRDFTINTLLFDPDNGEILDLTGKGISDIYDRILRTPLSPAKTLSLNPKIVLRGIRFKLELGLKVDPAYEKQVVHFIPALVDWLQKHPNSEMVQRTVKKIMEIDPKRGMEELNNIGISKHLPKSTEMDNAVKNDLFGITVSPTSLSASLSVEAQQTRMIKKLLEEREKHKAYMRRKKRENSQKTEKKFDIMDKARSGYYSQFDEPLDPDLLKRMKSMGQPGKDFIKKR